MEGLEITSVVPDEFPGVPGSCPHCHVGRLWMLETAVTLAGRVPAPGATTSMSMRTSSLTFTPQHLTCRTCGPSPATTRAVNEVGTIMARPWSMESPMEVPGLDAHVLVLAVTVKGDANSAPLAGV